MGRARGWPRGHGREVRSMSMAKRGRSAVSCFAGVLAAVALAGVAGAQEGLDTGDTAWMLTSTALVLLMTLPGLALFYAGLVRKKNDTATLDRKSTRLNSSHVTTSYAACCMERQKQ